MDIFSHLERYYRSILASIITILGFQACSSTDDDDEPMPEMYGPPVYLTNLYLHGRVTDYTNKPVENAAIVVKKYGEDKPISMSGKDTLWTNKNGAYEGYSVDELTEEPMLVECIPPTDTLSAAEKTIELGPNKDVYLPFELEKQFEATPSIEPTVYGPRPVKAIKRPTKP